MESWRARRRAELDQACDDYQLALEARMHELEARMEVKEVENVGAEQEEDKEVEEPRVDKQGGGALEPGEGDQSDAKAELECGAAKDDLLQGGGALEPGEGDQSDANDELVCRAAKDDFLQGGGAIDPGEGDCGIGAKVKVEVTCVGKVVTEIRVAQVQVERINVYKVRVEEFANLEVLRDGQLDPGEVCGSWKEAQWLVQQFGVNQELDEGWHSVGLRRHDFFGHDTEFELQEPEMELRFVSRGSGSLAMNSDFG